MKPFGILSGYRHQTAAKRWRPSHADDSTVLVGVRGPVASIGNSATLDLGSAPYLLKHPRVLEISAW